MEQRSAAGVGLSAFAATIKITIALTRAMTRGGEGCTRLLASSPQSQEFSADAVRKVHESELTTREQVVFAAFVDDADKAILCGAWIGDNRINLADNERRFVTLVVEAQRELFREALHGWSR
jgi:hypothetical protein